MMNFKKAIPRRTFLHGCGVSLALPFLDSMIPALAASETVKSPVRLGFVYVPNGIIMEQWTPAAQGRTFELMQIMHPLAPFRDQMLILTGLNNKAARLESGAQLAGPHASASGALLTGVHPRAGKAGISVDQIAARELGKHTQLSSLELSLDRGGGSGADGATSDAYLSTLSWRDASTPLPMENNPRKIFERLFGDSDSTPAERARRLRTTRSVLDSVGDEINRLLGTVGPTDRAKLDQYLEGVRDVERRVELTQSQSSRELPKVEPPNGIPKTYDDYAKLMFDLQVLAYQTDMTRVTTFLMDREKSERPYREIGISEGHHGLSHHSGNKEMIAKVAQINTYHVGLFAYLLEKMRSTADGDGSLLDHSLILYGSCMSNGSEHDPTNLPLALLGGAGDTRMGGRHLAFPEQPPVTNLFLAMLDRVGVPLHNFSDSTGKLDLLTAI
jgi:hypothetical protein